MVLSFILKISIKCFKIQNNISIDIYVDLIKRHCKVLIKGVDHLSEIKRTFQDNFLMSPLLKVFRFNSIRKNLCTEISKYQDKNFNWCTIERAPLGCSLKIFSSLMQEMVKITTIGNNDFNTVTFLHGFSLADFLRDISMRGYVCLEFRAIAKYWNCSNQISLS